MDRREHDGSTGAGWLRRRSRFSRLFAAHAISRSGDAFNTVALVILVFQLTGSGLTVAGTVVFEILPVLVLGPVAGVVADRFPRRRVMVAADLLRALLAGVLAISHGSVAVAYAVAFGLSVGSLLFNPAASSVVPETIDGNDAELVRANSALWSAAVIAQLVFAPAAGGLVASVGVGAAFGVNSLSFLLSALLLWRLDAGRRPAAGLARGWGAVRAGVDAVRSHPLLRRLVVVQGLASLSAGATSGLLVVLAAERFGVGPSGFGLLLAAIGVGAAAGPLVFRRSIRAGDRRWLFGPFALRGAVDLTLATTSSSLLAGGALAIYGVGTSTGTVAYQSTLQTEVSDDVRGRAFAVFDVVWNTARLVSLGLGGLAADVVGIRAVYVAGGVLLVVAALWGYLPESPTWARTPRRSHPA